MKAALVGAGAGALAPVAFLFRRPRPVRGGFADRGTPVGHRIRDGRFRGASGERERVPVVIVGGGIAGLSAAWRMRRLGFDEFVLLELEQEVGGNSRSGSNSVTRYPWGAHYVPIPNRRIPLVADLFQELGVLRNGRWDGAHVSRAPLSRLFVRGEWVEGLEPGAGVSAARSEQFDRFWGYMDYFRQGGEYTIPLRPPRDTAGLDALSMKAWMVGESLFDEHLRWYVDYACRDDYGCSYGEASAWAGIHYFASRPERDEAFLTWPDGNGWVARRLREATQSQVRTGSPVWSIRPRDQGLEVLTERITYECEAVVFAAPTFLAPFLVPEMRAGTPSLRAFSYSPWYTANLVLDRSPRETGAARSWENILYNSAGLGYVVATHQDPLAPAAPTVWTYYRALAGRDPRQARRELLEVSWEERVEEVLSDLEQAHPDLRDCVERVDIMRLGHGMIRPTTGFITSRERRQIAELDGPIQFANSDLSGISIFEEAQYRGVRAADRVLQRLGYSHLEYAQR